jgi:hypothetical protein
VGPCEGAAATQLFADQRNTLLQVNRSNARPVVIDAKLSQLVPDQSVPALKNEDNAARAATTTQTPDGLGSVGVAPTQLLFPLTPPVQAPAPPSPPTQAPPAQSSSSAPPTNPVEPKEAQQIFWGRFAPLALMPAETTLAAVLAQGSEQVGTILPYAMTRTPQTDMVMPVTGTSTFTLQPNSEAYLINSTTGIATQAAISSASLSINFGKSSFLTQLNLTANGSTHAISGSGGVSSTGKLFSDLTSAAAINGALAGKNATQAGYVFTQSLDSKTTAVGATLWGR